MAMSRYPEPSTISNFTGFFNYVNDATQIHSFFNLAVMFLVIIWFLVYLVQRSYGNKGLISATATTTVFSIFFTWMGWIPSGYPVVLIFALGITVFLDTKG